MEAVLELEKCWGKWAGVENVVACASGSAALHLALEALRLPPGSGVLCPDYTLVAIPRACALAGLVPVFVDVAPDDLNIDPDKIDEACSAADIPVSAVIAVHTYGRRARMDEVAALADKYGLAVVEDAAEAHGVPTHPRTDAYAVSHYRNKCVHGEEGGSVAFRRTAHADLARELRCLGFTADHDYRSVPRGWNYRLADSLARLVLDSLEHADLNLARRRQIEGWYDRHCPEAWRMPPRQSVWVYDVRLPGLTRERQGVMVRALNAAGIAARHGFFPLSLQEEYRGGRRPPCPVARRAAGEVFYLPADPRTATEEAAARAFEVLRRLAGQAPAG